MYRRYAHTRYARGERPIHLLTAQPGYPPAPVGGLELLVDSQRIFMRILCAKICLINVDRSQPAFDQTCTRPLSDKNAAPEMALGGLGSLKSASKPWRAANKNYRRAACQTMQNFCVNNLVALKCQSTHWSTAYWTVAAKEASIVTCSNKHSRRAVRRLTRGRATTGR